MRIIAIGTVVLALLSAAPLRAGPAAPPAGGGVAQAAADPVCLFTATERPRADAAITDRRRQPEDFILPDQALTVTADPGSGRGRIVLVSGRFTLPEVQAAVTAIDPAHTSLLKRAGKVWELGADLQIRRAAALRVTGDSAAELRLVSTAAVSSPAVINNGYLLLQRTKVVGWDGAKGAPDKSYADGRAFLLADQGGRTDVLDSEVAYLGYQDGRASGLAYRRCFDPADPTTGATGDIHNSDIHHNYFGMYSYEANAIWARGNKVHDNVYYGLDPHDYSHHFIFEGNEVYNNGKHGIIFSRWCEANIIRNNSVHDNAPGPQGGTAHGISLDRRSNFNLVLGNTVRRNDDGIVVFQSTDNLIQGNLSEGNGSAGRGGAGIRINATPVPPGPDGSPDRTPDQPAVRNLVLGNTVRGNRTYGIYLYARADSNTISDNTVEGNGRHDGDGLAPGAGIQITAGGNTVGPGNRLVGNGHGVSVADQTGSQSAPAGDDETARTPGDIALAVAAAPAAIEPGLPPGSGNIIRGNSISGNKSRGVRLVGAAQSSVEANEIAGNGDEGIYLVNGSANRIVGNFIHHNGLPAGQVDEDAMPDLGNYGINIKLSDPSRAGGGNLLSQNRVTANGRGAIKLNGGANGGISPPRILEVQPGAIRGDLALPGATVEVFRDPKAGCGRPLCDEAAEFFGAATAGPDGAWQVSGSTAGAFNYSASQTDGQGNSSQLFGPRLAPNVFVAPGRLRGAGNPTPRPLTIFVEGSDTALTLQEVRAMLAAQGHGDLLSDDGVIDGRRTWTLRANLNISPTVTLSIIGGEGVPSEQRVDWLRLRSDPGPLEPTPSPADPHHPFYDTTVFATLATYSGRLLIQGVTVNAWDTVNDRLDEELRDGRAYVLAKYDADLTIVGSDMSYLGYADGEAYGVSWRDVNPTTNADGTPYDPATQGYRTRVTGSAIDSTFSHNYYGVYTYQARDMVFRGNTFSSNVQYGFDPHDFTHDVLVEGNLAYDNGSHGFIISRGCNNFVFRNNISRDNRVKPGSKNPSAHGFMLDPGAPAADEPQAPATNNLYEGNQAYGNTGYGFRIFGSNDNIIRGNSFRDNWSGITLEHGSRGNLIAGNTIAGSTGQPVEGGGPPKGGHGVYASQGADGNTIVGNTITGHLNNGVYLKTAGNVVQENTVAGNRADGIAAAPDTADDQPAALVPGLFVDDREPAAWSPASATAPANNTIISNTVQANFDSGISLKDATGTLVTGNTVAGNASDGIYIAGASVGNLVQLNSVTGNQAYGIKVNGADSVRNTLSRNTASGNAGGGIAVTGGANGGIRAPGLSAGPDGTISGSGPPGATIELFSDSLQPAQAARYEGAVVADAAGAFSFRPAQPGGRYFTATATDAEGNSSGLPRQGPAAAGESQVFLPLVVR